MLPFKDTQQYIITIVAYTVYYVTSCNPIIFTKLLYYHVNITAMYFHSTGYKSNIIFVPHIMVAKVIL